MSRFLYLSRLLLNPRNAQVRKEVALPYENHRTILNAFPQHPIHLDRNDLRGTGILFRLEEDQRQGLLTLLVQSRVTPQWDFLKGKCDGRGYPYLLSADLVPDQNPNPAVVTFDLSEKIAMGQILSFRLRANPTVKKDRPEHKQGHRVAITDETQLSEWLSRKGEQGGFRILQVNINKEGIIRDRLHSIQLFSVLFNGILQVTDPTKLSETVQNGIGPAKGFGFGLLSLAQI